MNIYNYDNDGVYLGLSKANPNPLEPGNYLLPANSTTIAPPVTTLPEKPLFNGSSWEVVEDYRGQVAYSTVDATGVVIVDIGPIPEDKTLLSPEGLSHPHWNGSEWEEDLSLLKASKITTVKNYCDAKDAQPFLYNGIYYKSTNAISDTVVKISSNNLNDSAPIPCNSGFWDNVDLTQTSAFTCGEFKAFADAFFTRADNNYQNFKSHVAAIMQLTTATQVADYDYTTGWEN
jgi:hypothetical protein